MKSYIVHLKNKYPGGQVRSSEDSIDCYDASGEHVVALRKNGASGALVDAQKETGARDAFCLSPLPKEARVWKLHQDGSIGLDEEHAARKEAAAKLAVNGMVAGAPGKK